MLKLECLYVKDLYEDNLWHVVTQYAFWTEDEIQSWDLWWQLRLKWYWHVSRTADIF